MQKKSKNKQCSSSAAKVAANKYGGKIREYADKHKMPEVDQKIFGDALGYGRLTDTMLASDLFLRRRAAKFLAEKLVELARIRPKLKFYLWTFTHTIGNTSDREPVIDLKQMRTLIDAVLRKEQVDGLYVFEVQGLGNHPQNGDGRQIMFHAHGVQWAEKLIDAEGICQKWNGQDVWSNSLGAPPIDVQLIDADEDALKHIAYYMFKPPYDVKMAEFRKAGLRLKSTEKGYRPEFAVRMLELLCQLDLLELVRHSGNGKTVKANLARRLRHWHKSRANWTSGKLAKFHFDDLWDRYRVKKKKVEYRPFIIKR